MFSDCGSPQVTETTGKAEVGENYYILLWEDYILLPSCKIQEASSGVTCKITIKCALVTYDNDI